MRAIVALGVAAWCALASAANPPDRRELWKALNDGDFARLEALLAPVQRDYEATFKSDPNAERNLSRAFRVFFFADESTGVRYDAWVKAYPTSYAAALAQGEYLTAVVWKRRGPGFAREISPAQWDEARRVGVLAGAALKRSLGLTPMPILSYEYLLELDMATGAGGSADQLLAAARKLDLAAYYPSRAYLSTLRPQWGGSAEQMRAFVDDFRTLGAAQWKNDCLEAVLQDQQTWGSGKLAQKESLTPLSRAIELCPRADRYESRAYYYQQQRDFESAEKDLRAAIREGGSDWARAMLGALLVRTGRGEEGVPLCREAARADEPNALQCLAYAYDGGRGVPRDVPEAMRWLERAAQRGQTAGMVDLAEHYWRGDTLPQDKGKAIDWWRKAAAKDNAVARQRLADVGATP